MDESTCVTHSQSYFLNNMTQANINENISDANRYSFKEAKNNFVLPKYIEE
jgi:hypothetical protein